MLSFPARAGTAARAVPAQGGPCDAGAALGGLVLANYLNPMRWLRVPTEFGTLVISGSKITMEAPRLAGFTKDQREYEVTASRGLAGHAQSAIRGDEGNQRPHRHAGQEHGDADGGRRRLRHQGRSADARPGNPDRLDRGYQGRLTEAKVEIKKGRIVSEKPVQLKMPQGTLDANRMEVTETGAVIRFEGGVVMMLTPEARNNRGDADAAPPAAGEREMRARLSASADWHSRRGLAVLAGQRRALRSAAGEAAGHRRAECAAGLLAKQGQAGPDRGGSARSARQGQGGGVHRQCRRDPGRHHHEVQDAATSSTTRKKRRAAPRQEHA